MIASDTVPQGSIAGARDRFFGPTVLSPFAEDLAQRLSRVNVGPLLETLAGTGCLTQAISSAVSAGMAIIATDPDPEMVARSSDMPGMARVTWRVAEPLALPFADETFGVVTCHFWFTTIADRVRAFQEARRVLKPTGRLMFSLPGALRHNPVADCLQIALEDLFPRDPPNFLKQVFHGYCDHETVDDDLTAAGFTDAIYSVVDLPFVAASAREAATGYCLGTPLQPEIEVRAPGETERVIQAATLALETHFGTGSIASVMRAHAINAAG